MEDIAEIFIRHNLLIYDMWMYLPTCLFDEHFISDPDVYRAKRTGDRVFFDLYDQSDVYVHDYKTWRSYLTTTHIQCKNFGINIEHKANYGTFTHIRFTRTTYQAGEKYRMYPLTKLTTDVAIPDITQYVTEYNMTRKSNHMLLVAQPFVNRIFNWGTSANDTQYTYNNFAAYCNSIKNAVKYQQGNNQELVYEGINTTRS